VNNSDSSTAGQFEGSILHDLDLKWVVIHKQGLRPEHNSMVARLLKDAGWTEEVGDRKRRLFKVPEHR
jgi:hypothetical protein